MKGWRLNAEEYLDVPRRPRRLVLRPAPRWQGLDFALKLNAVTRGTFARPPTQVEAMYDRDFRGRKAGGRWWCGEGERGHGVLIASGRTQP